MYHAIGCFRQLRRLSLTLVTKPTGIGSVWSRLAPDGFDPFAPDNQDADLVKPFVYPENPHLTIDDDFIQSYTPTELDMPPYRNGHVLETMVNSALDARLARSIFHFSLSL